MAPKRSSILSKTGPGSKRARTDGPEGPLLAFLATAEGMPKVSREMLRIGLPLCLEVLESDRHKFQVEVLDRVASLLADTESKRREAIRTIEVSFAEIDVEKDKALANVELKKNVALAKQGECDEKGKLVDAAEDAADAARVASTTARQQVEAFSMKKSEMLLDKESFAKLLNDDFQPLKEGSFLGNWQRKNKVIGELKKKLVDVGGQQSLADAMAAALKLKPEQRSGVFAKAAMQFVEDCFAKHTAKVVEDISGLDAEDARNKFGVAAAEEIVMDKKGELQQIKKEWDELQDVWVKLEEDSAGATRSLKSLESQLTPLTKSVEKAKLELEKFLELPALFAKLRAQSTSVPEEPSAGEEIAAEEEKGGEEAIDGESRDEGMQV